MIKRSILLCAIGLFATVSFSELPRARANGESVPPPAIRAPGASLSDAHRASSEVIKDGLLKLGLITDRDSDQYRIWFMHGNGHWLGMNVHDVGGGARFEPGMTFTNEPGIYVRMDALDNLRSEER